MLSQTSCPGCPVRKAFEPASVSWRLARSSRDGRACIWLALMRSISVADRLLHVQKKKHHFSKRPPPEDHPPGLARLGTSTTSLCRDYGFTHDEAASSAASKTGLTPSRIFHSARLDGKASLSLSDVRVGCFGIAHCPPVVTAIRRTDGTAQ